jgi:GNAT superfamily N-acetyltransferase
MEPKGMKPIKIRPACRADAPALVTLLRTIGWWPSIDPRGVEQTLDMDLGGPGHRVAVAEDESETLIGYVAIHFQPCLFLDGPEGYVSELFVHPDHRSRGVGRLLLAAAEKEAKDIGCARLALVNGRQRESYQRGFYRKIGWVERDGLASFMKKLK